MTRRARLLTIVAVDALAWLLVAAGVWAIARVLA